MHLVTHLILRCWHNQSGVVDGERGGLAAKHGPLRVQFLAAVFWKKDCRRFPFICQTEHVIDVSGWCSCTLVDVFRDPVVSEETGDSPESKEMLADLDPRDLLECVEILAYKDCLVPLAPPVILVSRVTGRKSFL